MEGNYVVRGWRVGGDTCCVCTTQDRKVARAGAMYRQRWQLQAARGGRMPTAQDMLLLVLTRLDSAHLFPPSG